MDGQTDSKCNAEGLVSYYCINIYWMERKLVWTLSSSFQDELHYFCWSPASKLTYQTASMNIVSITVVGRMHADSSI